MRRPIALRLLPPRLAGAVYYRFYRSVPSSFAPLYQQARLRYAPDMLMNVPKGRDSMYDCIALMGVYEAELTRRVQGLARRGGLMIDVGANVGYFTLVWLANNALNKVLAFEPAPLVIPYLEENLRTNSVGTRVTVLTCAASARDGVARFNSISDSPTGWGRLASPSETVGAVGNDIQTVRLDSVIAKDERVAFLKIDVEGSESEVLDGALHLLDSRRVEHIYVEVNKPGARSLGHPESRALDILSTAGYKLSRLDQNTPIENWWASAP